jgi:hypothetical protein
MTTIASKDELDAIVAEDWEMDRRGRQTLSIEKLKDSLFELADLCALHASPADDDSALAHTLPKNPPPQV